MSEIVTNKERTKNIAVLFFAFVGFVASIVTILQYVAPEQSSKLQIDASYNTFRVPLYVGENLYSGSPARDIAKELKNRGCLDINPSDVESKSDAEIRSLGISDSKKKSASTCRQFIDIEYASRWAGGYSTGYSTLYQYAIKNDGSKVANGIRIDGTDVIALQYQRGRKFIDLRKDENESFYNLPSLNPQEKIDVLIWSDDYHSNDRYVKYEDIPTVTYSGSSVDVNITKRVPQIWYDIFSFFDGLPLLISAAFVVALSMIVVLALVLVISIGEALVTGKPISSIFKPKSQTEAAETAAE